MFPNRYVNRSVLGLSPVSKKGTFPNPLPSATDRRVEAYHRLSPTDRTVEPFSLSNTDRPLQQTDRSMEGFSWKLFPPTFAHRSLENNSWIEIPFECFQIDMSTEVFLGYRRYQKMEPFLNLYLLQQTDGWNPILFHPVPSCSTLFHPVPPNHHGPSCTDRSIDGRDSPENYFHQPLPIDPWQTILE